MTSQNSAAETFYHVVVISCTFRWTRPCLWHKLFFYTSFTKVSNYFSVAVTTYREIWLHSKGTNNLYNSLSSRHCFTAHHEVFFLYFISLTNLPPHRCAFHKPTQKTDRQTERQVNRQTDTQTDRQTDRQTGRQTDRQTNMQADRETGIRKYRERDRQKDRRQKTDKQIILFKTVEFLHPTYLQPLFTNPLCGYTWHFTCKYACSQTASSR